MGQVPHEARPAPYGIVGDGRVARHFHHYFTLLGLPVTGWSRRTSQQSPQAVLSDCRVVILAISDRAIESFAAEHPALSSARLVHFSGSRVIPGIAGFHPLCTFGTELYPLERYLEIPFVGDSNGPSFGEVFPELTNPSYRLDPALKPLYHALCCVAGNFSVLLWQRTMSEFTERLGLPREILIPFLDQTTRNLSRSPETALTGPLQRGDVATIDSHLRALEGDPLQPLYQSFVAYYSEVTR